MRAPGSKSTAPYPRRIHAMILSPPCVGAREIGYLFGQYKRITKDYVGVLTGKG